MTAPKSAGVESNGEFVEMCVVCVKLRHRSARPSCLSHLQKSGISYVD